MLNNKKLFWAALIVLNSVALGILFSGYFIKADYSLGQKESS